METIGGFRLVRRLGSGERAEVHLGQPSRVLDDAPARIAAIKVYRPTTSLTSIDEEIEALARLSSPHLLELHDLAIADDDRPVLVLQRLAPMTCSRLILERQHITAGEAVTILAPLTDAVEELSRVGVVHGGIRLDRIGFDDVGAPVLMGFGHARCIPSAGARLPDGTPVSGSADVAEPSRTVDGTDTTDLAALVRSLLEVTRPSSVRADLLGWLDAPLDDPMGFRAELRTRLFDFADPEPVSVTPVSRSPIGSAIDRQGAPAVSGYAAGFDDLVTGVSASAPDWLAPAHLPAWLRELLPTIGPASVRRVLAAGSTAVRRSLAPVRRPVWVAAGAVAVLLGAALVFSGFGKAGEAVAGSSVAESSPPVPDSDARDPVDDGATEPGDGADESATPSDAETSAITGEDPAAAASALLRTRAGCLRDLSVLCLDRVDQQDSAAMEADTALVRALQEGAVENRGLPQDAQQRRGPRADAEQGGSGTGVDFTTAIPAVTQILGGSVIVALTFPADTGAALPASVLLVRGDGGWRIRDLIVG